MDLFPNGWSSYLTGGLLAGAGVGLVYLTTGLRAGASSVFTTTWSYLSRRDYFRRDEFVASRGWRLVFSVGLVLGAAALAYGTTRGAAVDWVTAVAPWRLFVGGLLVGFGTRLSGGCTTGHGICGISAGSPPSMLAVATFMGVAIAFAHLTEALGLVP